MATGDDLCSPSSFVLLRLEKILRKAMMVRFIYVLIITGLAFLFPSASIKKDESLKGGYTALTLLLATVFVLGFSRAFAWYNLIIFPIVFILLTVILTKNGRILYETASRIRKNDIWDISGKDIVLFYF